MRMPVMNIREMRVSMRNGRVAVWMGMRLFAVPREIMHVLVMFIVTMPVVVIQRIVRVRMFVAFADMQPHAERHQRGRDPE